MRSLTSHQSQNWYVLLPSNRIADLLILLFLLAVIGAASSARSTPMPCLAYASTSWANSCGSPPRCRTAFALGILRLGTPKAQPWQLPFLALATLIGIFCVFALSEEFFLRARRPRRGSPLGSRLQQVIPLQPLNKRTGPQHLERPRYSVGSLQLPSPCFGGVHSRG